jgi:hypothetical protein
LDSRKEGAVAAAVEAGVDAVVEVAGGPAGGAGDADAASSERAMDAAVSRPTVADDDDDDDEAARMWDGPTPPSSETAEGSAPPPLRRALDACTPRAGAKEWGTLPGSGEPGERGEET